MSDSLFNLLTREIGRLLEPISYALENPKAMERLLASIGVRQANDEQAALINALRAVADLKTQVDQFMARPSPSLCDIAALLEVSDNAFTALRALKANGGSADAFKDLGQDLADFLFGNYLFLWHPLARDIAVLLTLIEPGDERPPRLPVVQDGQLLRELFYLDRFRLDRIVDLLRDPVATLRAEYGSSLATVDDANAIARKLFPRLVRVLRRLDVPCRYGFNPGDEEMLGDAAPLVEHAMIIYVEDVLAGAAAESGIVLNLSPADRGDLGLVVSPFGTLTFTKQVRNWTLEMALTAGIDLFAYGRHGLTLLASASTAEVKGRFSATLAAPSGGPAFILGSPTGTRLEVGGAQLAAETQLSEARQTFAVAAAVSSSAIVIGPGDADGFLSSFLPADGLRAKFDLGIAWSNERGFTLSGNAGLDATLPVGLSIGGVSIPTVHLGLRAGDAGLLTEVSASLKLSIGPVQALVDRVGITTTMTFPKEEGNLGVADLEVGFKPPSGAGLKIDSPSVTGGGFLFFDAERGQYGGVLQLEITKSNLSLKAIGLISTRLTSGAKGFSMIVIITAEGFKPIPLGLGFTLTGIGGLLAINRTFNEEAVRASIKSHALEQVLFPQDPILHAPQLFSSLDSFFPANKGSYMFGLLAQISWGMSSPLKMNLALILEVGQRLRLIVLGHVSLILPREEQDMVRLNLDAVGVIDFDQSTAALDATLYDSRLMKKFVLTGQMAMRLRWSDAPLFALSVGGFHPAFKPPPGFPALERIALSLSESDDFRLRCEGYFALTSNTLQFGAHAELFARAGGFSIHGKIGFDVLIQFDPFMFIAGFHASVQLKRGSTNLFKVQVEGELSGPRPLHVKGKATFEIFWCDFSVSFNKTLISGEAPPPPEKIRVMERLTAALKDARNWGGQVPESERRLATLRERRQPDEIALHPLGRLSVKQSVVPLELEIAKFGQAAPADARLFKINSVSVGGKSVGFERLRDFFAPAEFLEMTDDEKLTAPSFEPLTAGVSLNLEGFILPGNDIDVIEEPKLRYETYVIDDKDQPARQVFEPSGLHPALNAAHLDKQLSFGAAARSEVRRTGAAKFSPQSATKVLAKTGWVIVSGADQKRQSAPGIEAGKLVSYAEAFQSLQQLKLENPARAKGLKIIRASEPVT
jgi:hypothetical protein